jgi:hypothetical protein
MKLSKANTQKLSDIVDLWEDIMAIPLPSNSFVCAWLFEYPLDVIEYAFGITRLWSARAQNTQSREAARYATAVMRGQNQKVLAIEEALRDRPSKSYQGAKC